MQCIIYRSCIKGCKFGCGGGSKICKTWPILENNSAFESPRTGLMNVHVRHLL